MKKQVSQATMDAMKNLLNSYKTKDGLGHCPLCVVAKKGLVVTTIVLHVPGCCSDIKDEAIVKLMPVNDG